MGALARGLHDVDEAHPVRSRSWQSTEPSPGCWEREPTPTTCSHGPEWSTIQDARRTCPFDRNAPWWCALSESHAFVHQPPRGPGTISGASPLVVVRECRISAFTHQIGPT